MRVLTPERMILDAPIFRFTKREVENAIDSAIRLRLVSEARLRERVVAEHIRTGISAGILGPHVLSHGPPPSMAAPVEACPVWVYRYLLSPTYRRGPLPH